MTSPEIFKAAEHIRGSLAQIPQLEDVELAEFLSDGRTAYGGWVMPKCWNARAATLKVQAAAGQDALTLADYRENPFTLMMWSPPTPPGGIEASVAIAEPFKDGEKLRGKFALVGDMTQTGVGILRWAAQCGAVGLISDCVITRKGIKEGEYLDKAVQYWNYTNPQWDGEPRLPAFGLTPARGRELRAMLARNPGAKLHAVVDAELYDGVLPLVTACLPGRRSDEFVITAHMDEPGASDNASGAALGMEIMRCLAAESNARGRKALYGVRFFASVEARGLQAYLNTRGYRRALCGINLDMVGYDHTAGRTRLDVLCAQPSTPSILEFLLKESCEKEAAKLPPFTFAFSRTVAIDDCQFAGLPSGAPMCCVEQAPDRTYHCSLDTPENLSGPHLQRIGGIALDSARFFCEADNAAIEGLGERIFARAFADIAGGGDARAITADARAIFAQLIDMIPEGPVTPNRAMVETMRRNNELRGGYLYARHALEVKAAEWSKTLVDKAAAPANSATVRAASLSPLDPADESEARTLAPQKRFAGYLAFEDLTKAQREELLKKTGVEVGWAAPPWLQWALDLSSGKRSLLDIYSTVAPERKPKLRTLIEAIRFLERQGKVRFRKHLTKADVLASLRALGVKRGEIVMAHSSVSDFGYLEGGADAVIDALLEAVGPEGTVCVPTHSLNWIGKPPYDAKTSPSLTGAVPARFLRRPEAVRSLHPTHSVAAIGPQARALTDGHDHRVAPQAREGFWGKFVAAGGKVVMLCKLGSNTLLHGGELWAGVPYPPCECHYLQDGKRIELTVPGMPWHVHAFDLTHDDLRARGQLHEAKLGESVIYTMDAREAAETMMRIIRKDPTVAIRIGCSCEYCNYLREHMKTRQP